MHALGIETFASGHLEQRANDIAADLCGTGIAGNTKSISAAGDFYIEAAFDLSQVLIKLSAEIGETVVVGGLQNEVLGYLYGVQCWVRKPL